MKTLAITVVNKKQERLFTTLAEQLDIEVTEADFKPLTHKEAALGIGKKPSEKQLKEYLNRNTAGNPKSVSRLKADLKKRLAK